MSIVDASEFVKVEEEDVLDCCHQQLLRAF